MLAIIGDGQRMGDMDAFLLGFTVFGSHPMAEEGLDSK
jgi:hypothetical protein